MKRHHKPKRKTPTQTQLDHIFRELEKIIMSDKDLQAQVDALKVNVAALQAQPKPVPLISQEQLDSNVADISAANDALKALVPPAV